VRFLDESELARVLSFCGNDGARVCWIGIVGGSGEAWKAFGMCAGPAEVFGGDGCA